jgi:hypothetical protein
VSTVLSTYLTLAKMSEQERDSGSNKRERDFGRKYESGSAKRKKKSSWESYKSKLSGAMDRFVSSSSSNALSTESNIEEKTQLEANNNFPNTSNSNIDTVTSGTQSEVNDSYNLILDSSEEKDILSGSTKIGPGLSQNHSVVSPEVEDELSPPGPGTNRPTASDDPGDWVYPINDKDRATLVTQGPVRPQIVTYPLDKNNRHFSNFHYLRTLPNKEKQDRRYLVYSQKQDKVFCFACRLFSISNTSTFSSTGVNNWKNLGAYLKSHESSADHMDCVIKWLQFEKSLKTSSTVEDKLDTQIQAEKKTWRDILERVLAIIDYLSAHNLAFRGHREYLNENHSGNFLGLVKLLARFDPVLKVHIDQIQEKKLNTHYLGKNIQNELIELMAKQVKETILDHVRESKYYSIILDCTRDISRTEQMSLILRYVNVNTGHIEESFLGFLPVEITTGEMLTKSVLEELKKLGLDIENCRGQGYDNGSNMKGDYKGVKSRILAENPLAFFTPCGCHSWNLLLCDAASSCIKAKCFFGTLQRLYTLFSASSNRWSILKNKTNISLTLKPLSETRWECRIESVKALRYQLKEIAECLEELSDSTNDSATASECNTLTNEILSYDFILSLIIWYDLLVKIQFISKMWQRADMDLGSAINHFDKFLSWLAEYRNNGLVSAMVSGNEIAEELNISKEFKKIRHRKKKSSFSYEGEDNISSNAENLFRTDFFYILIDKITESTELRFIELKKYEERFGYLHRLNSLKDKSDREILSFCKQLQETLTFKTETTSNSDIDGEELYEELKMYCRTIPADLKISESVKLLIEKNLIDVYPNTYVALRIVLTIPVAVASAERSFSKLKLIKNYLRSTMSQERLSSLAILSVERDIASNLKYEKIIEQFSVAKSRKVVL